MLVRLRQKVQEVPRRVAVVAAGVALLAAGALHAATADPLLGSWRLTAGGNGSIVVQETSSLFKLVAGKTGLTLGCLTGTDGDIIGFVELPSHTRLPAGTYDATFGHPGGGCSYATTLKLNGSKLTGDVTYSENGEPGGPFVFARIGAAPKTKAFAWTVSVQRKGLRIVGRGSGSATTSGSVIAARGELEVTQQSTSFAATVDAPGSVRRGASGTFDVALALNATTSTCVGKFGTLVLTKGHVSVQGLCGAGTIQSAGTTTLR